MFESILSLRCLLLKQHNKEKWDQINEMESHNKIRQNISSLWDRNQKLVVDRIRHQWGYKEFSEEEIHTICGILEVNSFEVGTNGCRARALFPEAYLICHDCQPNTTHTDDPLTHKLKLRNTIPLKKGSTITLSYSYTLQVSSTLVFLSSHNFSRMFVISIKNFFEGLENLRKKNSKRKVLI